MSGSFSPTNKLLYMRTTEELELYTLVDCSRQRQYPSMHTSFQGIKGFVSVAAMGKTNPSTELPACAITLITSSLFSSQDHEY